MRALAQRAASRALDEDARKAGLNSPDDNIKAAQHAIHQTRLPSALHFALKAAEKKHADAHNLIGEIALGLGLNASAVAAFEASPSSFRTSVGRAAALAALPRPAAEVNAACEQAHKQCSAPDKQRLLLAKLQACGGSSDGAYESCLLAQSAQADAYAATDATLLACELELAMYAEAAWPQCKASRPERIQDKEKPDGVDLAAWRLQRGIDAARAHGKRVPQCVGASALAAEMLLECLLYRQMLMPKSKAASSPADSSSSGDPVAAASHDDDDDSTCSEKEEIRALMLMAGVKSAKQLG